MRWQEGLGPEGNPRRAWSTAKAIARYRWRPAVGYITNPSRGYRYPDEYQASREKIHTLCTVFKNASDHQPLLSLAFQELFDFNDVNSGNGSLLTSKGSSRRRRERVVIDRTTLLCCSEEGPKWWGNVTTRRADHEGPGQAATQCEGCTINSPLAPGAAGT
jgi:hypothetical protein